MTTVTAAKPSDAPRAAEVPERSRRILAALHAQSGVQEEAAAHFAIEGHALLTRPRGERSSTRRRVYGAATPAITASRSSRRSGARRATSTSPRPFSSLIPSPSSSRRVLRTSRRRDLDHVFFCNSGSEAVDTALKIALAYHNVRGHGSRQRLIGRERGYHGVGFGGISVGGMVNNRKFFGSLLAGVDHLPATYNREHQAFTKGEPEWGGHLADALESIVALHDASTIAAVIVEPMAGSTGVLPAPKGYLKRLREICDKYGILLIFRRGHHRLRTTRRAVRR